MSATIHERIGELVRQFGSSKNTVFAAKIGVSEGNIRGYIKGIMPKQDVLEKIVTCLDVSAEWLLTGNGDMLRQPVIASEKGKNRHISPMPVSSTPTPPTTPATPAPTPSISYNPNTGVPYYDVDFIAGFDLVINNQTITPTANIVVYGFEQAKAWCNATGHSMRPKINHGDMIALKECTLNDVQYGEIYAVVLDTLRTIKILRKSSDPNKLRYIPINIEEYDEQEFDKSRVVKIYEVLGNISRFM